MKVLFDGFGVTHHAGNSLGSYTNEVISLINNTEEEIDFNLLLYNINKPPLEISFSNINPLYLNIDRDPFPSQEINTIVDKYDIEVYHDPNNGFLAPKTQIPNYVITLNTLLPYLEPSLVDDKFKRNFFRRVPYSIESCKYLLAPSKSFIEDISKIFPKVKDKIVCAYPKTNEIFKPKPALEATNFLLNNYNITDPFILYVGDISKRKYIENLIFIMKNLSSTPLKLVLIGDYKRKKYPYYKHISELVSSLSLDDKVVFLGKIPQVNLPYFYSSALCTIDFSRYNSYPLSAVEAINCNSITIVNETPCNKEILNDSAFFVNSNNLTISIDLINTLYTKPHFKERLLTKLSSPISGNLSELFTIYK